MTSVHHDSLRFARLGPSISHWRSCTNGDCNVMTSLPSSMIGNYSPHASTQRKGTCNHDWSCQLRLDQQELQDISRFRKVTLETRHALNWRCLTQHRKDWASRSWRCCWGTVGPLQGFDKCLSALRSMFPADHQFTGQPVLIGGSIRTC